MYVDMCVSLHIQEKEEVGEGGGGRGRERREEKEGLRFFFHNPSYIPLG